MPAYTLRAYLADRSWQVATSALSDLLLMGALRVLGNEAQATALCVGIVAIGQLAVLAFGYLRRAPFFRDARSFASSASTSAELLALLPEARQLEARCAHGLADAVALAAADELAEVKATARAQREYVELWTHEVKAPIAAARLALADAHGELADALSLQLDRIESRVAQALYLARAESVAADYTIRRVDLVVLTREACKRNAGLLISAGVVPRVEVGEGLVAHADAQWTGFVLDQLLTNAAKYGASTVVMTAREEGTGTSAGRVVLAVADDGWGIPAADVPRVFERAFVGENGRRAGSGTGIGLYLVATLCARMGVGCTLTSEEGKGTTVELSFPLNRANAELVGAQGAGRG